MGSGDQGRVQISVNNGPWQDVPGFGGPYDGNNNAWSQGYLPLATFIDSTIRIGFYFTSNYDAYTVGNGWYIDDVRFDGMPSAIELVLSQIPVEGNKLSPNYPNPFNPTTILSFDLPKASNVKLSVFDLQGKIVEQLVEGWRQPGSYQLVWDAGDFPSGIYVARFETDDFMQSQKMILVK